MNPFSSEEFWQCFPTSKTVPYARYRCSLTPSLSLLVSNYLLLSLRMEGEEKEQRLLHTWILLMWLLRVFPPH